MPKTNYVHKINILTPKVTKEVSKYRFSWSRNHIMMLDIKFDEKETVGAHYECQPLCRNCKNGLKSLIRHLEKSKRCLYIDFQGQRIYFWDHNSNLMKRKP